MPERNPFEETRRAGVPLRTPIQSGGPGGEFGGTQRLYTGRNPFTTPNDPGMDFGVPGPPRPEESPWDRPFRPIPGPRPPGGVGPIPSPRGPGPGWDRPFRPIPGTTSGELPGDYLASRFGGGLDDVAAMNDGARGMIEDAGFDVAGQTTDSRTERKLWGQAVNSFPPGTPDMVLQQEWERLKQDYFNRKYGGGPTFPSRDDIVGLS